MTALERLIKTASMDAAPHYREMAKEAQRELNTLSMLHWLRSRESKKQTESPCTPPFFDGKEP